MSITSFSAELEQFGPDADIEEGISLVAAQQYCRRLARTHYENFTVVSWLLPKRLQQPFYNVYAYCRWADDLADETNSQQESLRLLDWWEEELQQCYQGHPRHPIFVALASTIKQFEIPQQPFANLLVAFRQDQEKNRYENFTELLAYCKNSANPVGHLVLYLGNSFNDENAKLSDSICTGLQLANFWQDVARDQQLDRLYLPLDSLQRHQYSLSDWENRITNDAFRAMLVEEVERAENYLNAGRPLIDSVSSELSLEIELFIEGGLAILNAIRKLNYGVWQQRPTVSKFKKVQLFATSWFNQRRNRKKRQQEVAR